MIEKKKENETMAELESRLRSQYPAPRFDVRGQYFDHEPDVVEDFSAFFYLEEVEIEGETYYTFSSEGINLGNSGYDEFPYYISERAAEVAAIQNVKASGGSLNFQTMIYTGKKTVPGKDIPESGRFMVVDHESSDSGVFDPGYVGSNYE